MHALLLFSPSPCLPIVIPGLVPGIHVLPPFRHPGVAIFQASCQFRDGGVDDRDKPGHDGGIKGMAEPDPRAAYAGMTIGMVP
jgi:hypothetical protein